MQLVSIRSEQDIQDYRTELQIRKDPRMFDFYCAACRKNYFLTSADLLDDPDCSCTRCGKPHR